MKKADGKKCDMAMKEKEASKDGKKMPSKKEHKEKSEKRKAK